MSSTALVTAAHAQYTDEQRRLITDVLCKGASGTEVEFFFQVAQRCNLDPFRRQIHAVKRWDSTLRRDVLTFQVGIDGLRAIAARTGEYAGSDDVTFVTDGSGHPVEAVATVWRLVKGNRVAFTARVWWTECVQTVSESKGGGPNSMWKKRPFGQLGKCAEAAALRKGFPEETSGLYIEEEITHEAAPQPSGATFPTSDSVQTRDEAEIQQVESAPTASDEPIEDPEAALLQDFLFGVGEIERAQDLTHAAGQTRTFTKEAHRKAASAAVLAKAKELGLVWKGTKTEGRFELP
jgi:phage recombination protein Bet